MRERDARWRVLRVLSEYPLPVNGYPKRKRGRPSGLRAVLCSGTGWDRGTPVGPIPGPAVHSDGDTALHWAAEYGKHRIVRLLIAFNADVKAQNDDGCAVSAAANRP